MRNLKVYFTDIMDEQDAQSYAEKKLTPLEQFIKHDPESIKWNLRISREEHATTAHVFVAEASLHSSKKNFGAEGRAESVHAAIDELKDSLQKKMSRYKGKKMSVFKKGARMAKQLLRKAE